MLPLFGDKEFRRVGFPTPDSLPEETACRTLTIPGSTAWLAVVMGCLYTLTDPEAWQQFEGGITRDEAAERAAVMIDQAYADITEGCATDIAPWWNDESDIEGEIPEGEVQNWWGVFDGLTFQESLENVFIAAYVGILAGPAAAAQFLVLARQFRLEFESDPYGGIVDIFVNSERYTSVDTYSPTPAIIGVDIIASDPESFSAFDLDPQTLMVVLSDEVNPAVTPGSQVMHVVRKQLIASEVSPVNARYNSETNTAQYSPDGGETWTDNPGGDPRHNPAYQQPPLTTSDPPCDAAANATQRLRDTIDIVIAAPSTLFMINKLLEYVKQFIPEIQLIIDIISYVANLLNIIKDDLEDAFTSTVYDDIQCIIYCHLDNDGICTADALSDMTSDVHDLDDATVSTAWDIIVGILWGEVGLTNAGATGSETGDCGDCECSWCYEYDFTADDWGFEADSAVGNNCAAYVPGSGWQSGSFNLPSPNNRGVFIRKLFGTTLQIRNINFEYSATAPVTSSVLALTNGSYGTLGLSVETATTPTGTNDTAWSSGVQGLRLQVGNVASGTPSGNAFITKLTIEGVGTEPPDGVACL